MKKKPVAKSSARCTKRSASRDLLATKFPIFAEPEGSWDRISAGAGNGIRTRDPDLGKVVLYH